MPKLIAISKGHQPVGDTGAPGSVARGDEEYPIVSKIADETLDAIIDKVGEKLTSSIIFIPFWTMPRQKSIW